jgi:hypothetical protein|tara:strand:- start:1096 stop:1329 length:234 start_codon:yes stop_codon:yes gene_type:complete
VINMPGRARGNPHRKPAGIGGFRTRQRQAGSTRPARYPWHAWPANDNKPPVWRGALGWALVGMGVGCFAFVAVTLLL